MPLAALFLSASSMAVRKASGLLSFSAAAGAPLCPRAGTEQISEQTKQPRSAVARVFKFI
jgi:hypothetical protein